MGSFALATQGYPQNASVQNQFANALNASVTTYAPVQILAATSAAPATLAFAAGTVSVTYFAATVTGDTGTGRGLAGVRSDGYGALTAQASTGTLQATLYGVAGGGIKTDQNWTVNGTASVNGTLTLAGGSTTAGANATGVFTCNGTVFGTAPALAAAGNFLTNTGGITAGAYDDSGAANTHLDMADQTGTTNPGAARAYLLRSVDATNTPAAGVGFSNGGHITVPTSAQGAHFDAKGGATYFSRVSAAATGAFTSSVTISHGMGTTPDAGVATEGDGGSGGSATFAHGFNSLGSTNVTLSSGLGSSCWMRFLGLKFGN